MLTTSSRNTRGGGSALGHGLALLVTVSAAAFLTACGSGGDSPTGPGPAAEATPAPEATPTPTPAPVATCVPTMESPAHGATLDNGRTDGLDELVWDFDWADCAGATLYHLYVKRSGAASPQVDRDDLASSWYNHGLDGYVSSANLTGWTWKVRARVAGQWGEWSPERPFQVEPPNTDPPNICVPTLVSPAEGATLDNGRTDHTNNKVWTFDWSSCPGASRYHLYVKHSAAVNPAIDKDNLTVSIYQDVTNSYVSSGSLTGWTWKVRAMTDGMWGAWSPARSFKVEPPNTD